MKTPTMDRMAAEGFSFSQCVSNYPVCSPYRAIVMTGRWPWQSSRGKADNSIPLAPESATIGKAFQAAGYRTGYIGKWHLGGTRAEAFGFDTSLIWEHTTNHFDAAEYHPAGGEPVKPKGYNATRMTNQALDFIGENKSRPFFLMLSLESAPFQVYRCPAGEARPVPRRLSALPPEL